MRTILLIICLPFTICAQNNVINNDFSWIFDSEISKFDTSFNSLSSSLFDYSRIDDFQMDSLFLNSKTLKKIFNNDLLSFINKDYNIKVNPIVDFSLGNDSYFSSMRGAFLYGSIKKNFRWFSLYYENYRKFSGKTSDIVNNNAVSPGESEVKFGDNAIDYSVAQGGMEYRFSKFFNLTLGHGKNFIGNGYRSLLLSDVSNSYPYLKTEITIGKVKYSSIVAELIDFTNDLTFDRLKRKKYGSFHFLEILATKKIHLGLFESVIWSGDSTSRSDFDINYVNPFVVFRPIEYNIGSPDNMLIGFNGSWDITKYLKIYSQIILDEFHSKNLLENPTWWANKYGYQLGFKVHELKKHPNLVVILEHNAVRPFTYSHKESAFNYGHNYEALAHPYGANFREYLGIVNYRKKRWNANLKCTFIKGGAEMTDSVSVGTDIFKSYFDRQNDNGYSIGYGGDYQQLMIDGKLSYILNYKYLLMAQVGVSHRLQILDEQTWDENFIFFGIKTSLFNLYYDF